MELILVFCNLFDIYQFLDNSIKPDFADNCKKVKMAKEGEDPAVTLFRDYLRIKSVHPDPDYDSCLVFLRKQAERLKLKHHTTEMVKGKPIFIMTWPGTNPDFPALLLNSHMDVVPVFPESWKYDAFEVDMPIYHIFCCTVRSRYVGDFV